MEKGFTYTYGTYVEPFTRNHMDKYLQEPFCVKSVMNSNKSRIYVFYPKSATLCFNGTEKCNHSALTVVINSKYL